jgi:hypothetical protein
MCEDMYNLRQGKIGYIDLYWNDVYGLKKSIK